jgi:hypothetical protein
MYVCIYIYITSYIIDVQLYYDNFGIYIYNIIYIPIDLLMMQFTQIRIN